MTTGYTPSTDAVRKAYMWGMQDALLTYEGERDAEFDRWLTIERRIAALTTLRHFAEAPK